MLVYGVSADQVKTAVETVSAYWDGNVQLKSLTDKSNSRGPRASYALRAVSSRKVGARCSGSGRRTVASCWHVHRDVLRELFKINPKARVVSGLGERVDGKFKRTVYNGSDGFERDFPDTAWINVGSDWFPAYIGQLCTVESE
jgi:hypothetical protein